MEKTCSLEEKSASIYWMGGWVTAKAGLGPAKNKKTLSFSRTEQWAPLRSDLNIIVIIIQLPQHQPMLTTGCFVCFMKQENTQRKERRLELPSESLR